MTDECIYIFNLAIDHPTLDNFLKLQGIKQTIAGRIPEEKGIAGIIGYLQDRREGGGGGEGRVGGPGPAKVLYRHTILHKKGESKRTLQAEIAEHKYTMKKK